MFSFLLFSILASHTLRKCYGMCFYFSSSIPSERSLCIYVFVIGMKRGIISIFMFIRFVASLYYSTAMEQAPIGSFPILEVCPVYVYVPCSFVVRTRALLSSWFVRAAHMYNIYKWNVWCVLVSSSSYRRNIQYTGNSITKITQIQISFIKPSVWSARVSVVVRASYRIDAGFLVLPFKRTSKQSQTTFKHLKNNNKKKKNRAEISNNIFSQSV